MAGHGDNDYDIQDIPDDELFREPHPAEFAHPPAVTYYQPDQAAGSFPPPQVVYQGGPSAYGPYVPGYTHPMFPIVPPTGFGHPSYNQGHFHGQPGRVQSNEQSHDETRQLRRRLRDRENKLGKTRNELKARDVLVANLKSTIEKKDAALSEASLKEALLKETALKEAALKEASQTNAGSGGTPRRRSASPLPRTLDLDREEGPRLDNAATRETNARGSNAWDKPLFALLRDTQQQNSYMVRIDGTDESWDIVTGWANNKDKWNMVSQHKGRPRCFYVSFPLTWEERKMPAPQPNNTEPPSTSLEVQDGQQHTQAGSFNVPSNEPANYAAEERQETIDASLGDLHLQDMA
ncbi:hypothetical protein IL306_013344 [Fusarium sp. DS 682]|nr:hypothetical protein IL306_013344 [Fusarium sp. DS 682]